MAQRVIEPKEEQADTLAQLPKIGLTFSLIKDKIDAELGKRPPCPDAVIKEIIRTNAVSNIPEIKKALDAIARVAGNYAWDVFKAIGNEEITALFVEKPKVVSDAFVEIATAAGNDASWAFKALGNEKVAALFLQNPKLVTDAFVGIAKAAEKGAWEAFSALGNDKIASLFIQNPSAFVDIANIAGDAVGPAFGALGNDKIASLFIQDPKHVIDAYAKIIGAAGGDGRYAAFASLGNQTTWLDVAWATGVARVGTPPYPWVNDRITVLFIDYCNKKIPFNQLILPLLSCDLAATEIGSSLDMLHSNEPERKKYLDSLTTFQVSALLLSNPGYFFTSTNHMLFDRLKKDLGNKTITEFFRENALIGTDLCRNFLFRAITYDRFYGQANSVLGAEDVTALFPTFTEPLKAERFTWVYFFRLANALDRIRTVAGVEVYQIIESRLKVGIADGRLSSALEYAYYLFDTHTSFVSEAKKRKIRELGKKAIFNPELYKNSGKFTVLQVFDKKDTEKDHWGLTQEWFTRYFGRKPIKGPNGELVYENKTAKMILYMGENEEQNQEFVRQQHNATPNMILTFRGHSFSLEKNLPFSVFENRECNILFIPGSCGSASSTPQYMEANPKMDLRFISNTSTGRGQVTNAILETLLGSKEGQFDSILSGSRLIEKAGGTTASLKAWSAGEALIKYVQEENPE